jgi:CDP-diacylglycerol---serine O-phosphatidyltransferase
VGNRGGLAKDRRAKTSRRLFECLGPPRGIEADQADFLADEEWSFHESAVRDEQRERLRFAHLVKTSSQTAITILDTGGVEKLSNSSALHLQHLPEFGQRGRLLIDRPLEERDASILQPARGFATRAALRVSVEGERYLHATPLPVWKPDAKTRFVLLDRGKRLHQAPVWNVWLLCATNQATVNISDPVRPKRFSMIRSFVAADFLTLGNGACGSGSVLAAMQYLVTSNARWWVLAAALLPVALILDFADGRVARWRRRSSLLGADLDSLADVISFGLAPAALGFAAGLRGELDVAVLLYFVACGISRLARFNATAVDLADESGKVKYFEGTPIPTSVFIVIVLAALHFLGRTGADFWLGQWSVLGFVLHPFSLLYFASGSLMISTIRVPKI